ncbi:hypothetical protein HaLaN_14449 [Haematococcus lacustris]|uniref:Uncharacterized protein n=1 Tax=Haematococcus lacustris TaxID=44745 RepID=A0A699ZFS7_HAELA|nr:hypothetical protein HaLaN_14449 [Haematococcus lacustris]
MAPYSAQSKAKAATPPTQTRWLTLVAGLVAGYILGMVIMETADVMYTSKVEHAMHAATPAEEPAFRLHRTVDMKLGKEPDFLLHVMDCARGYQKGPQVHWHANLTDHTEAAPWPSTLSLHCSGTLSVDPYKTRVSLTLALPKGTYTKGTSNRACQVH